MPPCITAITSQKKNKNRINIFIDGQYAFSISRALAADIREGDEIRPNRIDQLKKADEQETAYGRALHFLKFRPRSAAEIERYLEGKHFSLETITTTVNRLETHGLIDDAAFARLFVENRQSKVLLGEIKTSYRSQFGRMRVPGLLASLLVVLFSVKEYLRCRFIEIM